jgi:hypothetical protein
LKWMWWTFTMTFGLECIIFIFFIAWTLFSCHKILFYSKLEPRNVFWKLKIKKWNLFLFCLIFLISWRLDLKPCY